MCYNFNTLKSCQLSTALKKITNEREANSSETNGERLAQAVASFSLIEAVEHEGCRVVSAGEGGFGVTGGMA